jgi:sterol desaturase/sphingolipid hydroxylase (fatty acid hydroxylase superfamily)
MSLAQLQILSPIAIVGAALAFIGLERLFPYNKGQRIFRDGFWVDLIGYGVVQSYLMGLLISALIYFIDNRTHISRFHVVTDWPIWAQVLLFIVWHDLNTYLIHRYQHNQKFLWRTHEAHHACTNVDWLSGIRSHSLEILLYQTVEFLPVILLGAAPEVPLYKGMANSIYGMYIHANLNWKMGPLLYIFNGPELHRWHHANDDAGAFDRNYATKFSIWDRLLGTYYEPKSIATNYGPEDPNFPKGWIRQHLYAFRRFPRPQK